MLYNAGHWTDTRRGETTMIDRTFDPNTMIAAAREAFAPVLKAQQEGFKTLERLARLQYAVAGDVLESGLARVNVDRKSTRLNSSHSQISYAVFCLKKKNKTHQ